MNYCKWREVVSDNRYDEAENKHINPTIHCDHLVGINSYGEVILKSEKRTITVQFRFCPYCGDNIQNDSVA